MYSVVIVDDESGACNIIKSFIDTNLSDFFVSKCFLSSCEALSYLLVNRVDVVVTDIKMPVMDGIEMTRKLRENNDNSKIIFLSGYDDFSYAKKAIEYGVFNYILKPVDFAELNRTFSRIKELLDNSVSEKDSVTDLIFDVFTQENQKSVSELQLELAHSELPDVIKRFKGHVFRLKMNGYEEYVENEWKDDNRTMDDVIIGIIRMSVPDSYVFHLYNKNDVLMFVIFCNDVPDLVSVIAVALKNILPFEYRLKEMYSFSNIEQAAEFNKLNGNVLYEDKKLANEEFVIKVQEFLKSNHNRNISLSDLSSVFHMNAVYLARVFKQNTGLSPYEYHLNVRMNKAVYLLISGQKIESISRELGYVDKRTFFRNFKSHTGYSPSEYREMMIKEFD